MIYYPALYHSDMSKMDPLYGSSIVADSVPINLSSDSVPFIVEYFSKLNPNKP